MIFPFSKVGYVSSLKGTLNLWSFRITEANENHIDRAQNTEAEPTRRSTRRKVGCIAQWLAPTSTPLNLGYNPTYP